MFSFVRKITLIGRLKAIFGNRNESPSQEIKQNHVGGDAIAKNVLDVTHDESSKRKKRRAEN